MEQLRPGDPGRIGRYRLVGRLGEGGMGQVFLGLSPGGRQVAVKVIHPGHANSGQFRERFAREIEAARRVGGYYTASVVDADPAADPPWMATAFIQGPSLQQAVAASGPFGLDRVRQLGAGLAEGLAAIHACGLVHRDLKPSNVILADDGPRIIDFGIARAAGASSMTTTGMVVGTYSYMSPEQLRGDLAGPPSDVFALGCTLAYAATARVTFGEDSVVTVMYRITTEPADLAGVPEGLGFRQLISECLAKNPADRPGLAAIIQRLAEPGNEAGTAPADPAVTPQYAPTQSVPTGDRTAPPPERVAGQPDRVAAPGPQYPAPAQQHPEARPQNPPPAQQYPGAGPQNPPPAQQYPGAGPQNPPPAQQYPTAGPHYPAPAQQYPGAGPQNPGLGQPYPGPPYPEPPYPGAAGPVRPDQQPPWPPGQPGGPRPGRRRRRGLLIGGVAAVAVAGTVAALLLSGNSKPASHPAVAQSSAPASGHPSARPTVSAAPGVPSQPQLSLQDPDGRKVFGDVFASETVLATGDGNGNSYLWNMATGKVITTLHDPNSNGVNGIAYSQASGSYAVADANGGIYLWSAQGKLLATLSNGTRDNDRVAVNPDGSLVAVGSNGGSTYLWEVAAGQANSTSTRSLHDPGGKNVYGVAFSPNGSLLAAGDTNGSVYLWNVATGQHTATLNDPASQGLYDVAFSPDGNLLAVSDVSSSTSDGVVYLWNLSTGKLAGTLESFYNSEFADITFSPDGRFLAAGDTIGNVSFWNVATGKYVQTLSNPLGNSVIGVAFSPSGHLLASTDTEGHAYVWNTAWLSG